MVGLFYQYNLNSHLILSTFAVYNAYIFPTGKNLNFNMKWIQNHLQTAKLNHKFYPIPTLTIGASTLTTEVVGYIRSERNA